MRPILDQNAQKHNMSKVSDWRQHSQYNHKSSENKCTSILGINDTEVSNSTDRQICTELFGSLLFVVVGQQGWGIHITIRNCDEEICNEQGQRHHIVCHVAPNNRPDSCQKERNQRTRCDDTWSATHGNKSETHPH